MRYCHVGFYLIDKGLILLEKELGICRSFWLKRYVVSLETGHC